MNLEENKMKRKYAKPFVQKIEYAYEEQVVARSYPLRDYADPWNGGKCTWGGSSCSIIYNTPKARGWDDCENQGVIG